MFPFTLQQLRILQALANEKNFTRAANSVYLSQPSVSKQIQKLETTLHRVLLNRETQTFSFTEHGKLMVEYAERILALSEECCQSLLELQTGERGTVRIGISQSVHPLFLTKILQLFTKQYPQIHQTVRIDSMTILSQRMKDQEVDVCFLEGDIDHDFAKNVWKETFLTDEVGVMVPNFHPLPSNTPISKEDLYRCQFLTLPSTTRFRQFLDQSLLQNQIAIDKLTILMELNSVDAIQLGVRLGLGFAFLPASILETDQNRKSLKVIKIENSQIRQSVAMIINSQSFQNQAVMLFYLELVRLQQSLER